MVAFMNIVCVAISFHLITERFIKVQTKLNPSMYSTVEILLTPIADREVQTPICGSTPDSYSRQGGAVFE